MSKSVFKRIYTFSFTGNFIENYTLMKKQKMQLSQKLTFRKATIAKLNGEQKEAIAGGATIGATCLPPTNQSQCITQLVCPTQVACPTQDLEVQIDHLLRI